MIWGARPYFWKHPIGFIFSCQVGKQDTERKKLPKVQRWPEGQWEKPSGTKPGVLKEIWPLERMLFWEGYQQKQCAWAKSRSNKDFGQKLFHKPWKIKSLPFLINLILSESIWWHFTAAMSSKTGILLVLTLHTQISAFWKSNQTCFDVFEIWGNDKDPSTSSNPHLPTSQKTSWKTLEAESVSVFPTGNLSIS